MMKNRAENHQNGGLHVSAWRFDKLRITKCKQYFSWFNFPINDERYQVSPITVAMLKML